MKRSLLLAGLVAGLLALVVLADASGARAGSPLHPPVTLLGADGSDVLETGAPVSLRKTCGECHDTDYIAAHSYHSTVGFDERFAPGSRDGVPPWNFSPGMFGRWDAHRYRRMTLPGDASFDLGVADWIRTFGERHAGGGPALLTREGEPLADRVATEVVHPETHVLQSETGRPVPWDWQQSGGVEMNCFLCHLEDPADDARIASLESGAFRWASTATLENTGLVEKAEDGTWRYVRDRFDEDGDAPQAVLRIGDPRSTNCGLCHGDVHVGRTPVIFHADLKHWETQSKGQIFSAQPIRDSGLNLKDKASLWQAWDVHAARLVECTNCHTSLNNPVSFAEADRSRPRHLQYDARRLQVGEYLSKPSHNFTKGESAQGTVARRLDGTMRRCEDCHDAVATHAEWLPNPRRHLTVMLCESCHIPRVHAPAYRSCDWTVLTPEHEPRVEHRGAEGNVRDTRTVIQGFQPVILPRTQKNGRIRHGPHNLATGFYWVDGAIDRPVRLVDLEKAFFTEDDRYHPDLVAALDADGSGEIEHGELRLDDDAKVGAVRARLEAVGVKAPRIEGCIQPLSLHHGVVEGQFATRQCEVCHSKDSRLTQPFELSAYVPAGAEPKLVGDSNIRMPGRTWIDEQGRLLYQPTPTASGRYVIGHDRAGWIDQVGILVILATIAGVVLHACLRRRFSRTRDGEAS